MELVDKIRTLVENQPAGGEPAFRAEAGKPRRASAPINFNLAIPSRIAGCDAFRRSSRSSIRHAETMPVRPSFRDFQQLKHRLKCRKGHVSRTCRPRRTH